MLRKRVGFFHLILWRGCTYVAVSPGSRGGPGSLAISSATIMGINLKGQNFPGFMRGTLDKVAF